MSTRKNAAKTRGRPFAPGNAGRPRGSRNKTSILAEQLLEAGVDAVAKSVVAAAKRGNMVAAKIVLDRLVPPRRGRPVQFDLPPASDTAGLVSAFAALTAGVSSGQLSPEEASAVAAVLEAQRKAIEMHDLSVRVTALEAARSA